MKATINGGIYRCQHTYSDDHYYAFFGFDASDESRVKVMDHTIEVEIPDDFDPRPAMVEALEARKKVITAEFYARVNEINGKIQSLLALEGPVSEVTA